MGKPQLLGTFREGGDVFLPLAQGQMMGVATCQQEIQFQVSGYKEYSYKKFSIGCF